MEEQAFTSLAGIRKYTEPSIHQPLQRTIAFSLPAKLEVQKIVDALCTNGAKAHVVDLYQYTEDGAEKRAITFKLFYDNPKGNLSAEDINGRLQELITLITTKFGPLGVQHR